MELSIYDSLLLLQLVGNILISTTHTIEVEPFSDSFAVPLEPCFDLIRSDLYSTVI